MKDPITLRSRRTNDHESAAFTLVDLLAVLAGVTMLLLMALPALAATRGKSKAMQCLDNVRSVNIGTALFIQENGCYPPLYRVWPNSGWPNWKYDSATFVVQNASALFWPDALRLEGYVKDTGVFSCPALTSPALRGIGGGYSTKFALGIGMNFPSIGTLISSGGFSQLTRKASDVKNPSQTVVFGDSGAVTVTSRSLSPDDWLGDTTLGSGGSVYFRTPADPNNFTSGDARLLPRHDRRVVTGWADGHVELIQNSRIGWEYPQGHANALWDLF